MIMTVDQLRTAREESANVAYLTFAKHINSDKLGLFCFFEGKDSPYYALRVKSIFKGNYYPITCGNKSKVLKVYELIENHSVYEVYKKAFFIDSDFEPSKSNDKIYETPCYSIENLYTSASVFGEILKSELGFSETDEDFEHCMNLYKDLQEKFHDAATLFNAWYACLVYIRNTTGQKTGVILEGSIPKEFLTISLSGISGYYDISTIKSKYPQALNVEDHIVEQKTLEFGTQKRGRVFRGKFEMDFMLKILNALIVDSNTSRKFVSKPLKYAIVNTQAISQFSQYAETPENLLGYIKKMIA